MTIQNQINLFTLCNFSVLPVSPDPIHYQAVSASSLDYGFDFDEDALAKELLASQSADLADQTIQYIEADEFEIIYRWFSS